MLLTLLKFEHYHKIILTRRRFSPRLGGQMAALEKGNMLYKLSFSSLLANRNLSLLREQNRLTVSDLRVALGQNRSYVWAKAQLREVLVTTVLITKWR